jgi:NAD(P)-dependent dehydrogenase (short-subunit alcohol dehydrogenase family)
VDRLQARHALVTGAGRGIGRAIAVGLAEEGAFVTLVARSRQALDEVAAEIHAAGGRASVAAADVSTPEGVATITSPPDWPPVDILVNAAGVFGPMQLIAESDVDQWLGTIRTNQFSVYLTCRRYVPAMMAEGWGRVLNVTSAASLHAPGPLNSAYATSKAAINQFTRHLAAELRGTGVTANVFHPGDVRTQMFEDVRAGVQQAGELAAGNYDPWVQWVERTGGDSPRKAVDLVVRVATDERGIPNGEFLWIDDPLQPAVPSWTTDGEAPSYV